MARKLCRIQKESGTMRKKITRGAPLILHHLKFSNKDKENHQFLLCRKKRKEKKISRRRKTPPSYIEHKKSREDKNHHENYYHT